MNLPALIRAVAARDPFVALAPVADSCPHVPVTNVVYDSRLASAGAVFVALRGLQADGAAFSRDAVTRGAIAIFGEGPRPEGIPVPWLQVADARLALAALSHEFFGRPSERIEDLSQGGRLNRVQGMQD